MQPFTIVEPMEDDEADIGIAYTLQAVLELAIKDMGSDAVRQLVEDTIATDGLELN